MGEATVGKGWRPFWLYALPTLIVSEVVIGVGLYGLRTQMGATSGESWCFVVVATALMGLVAFGSAWCFFKEERKV